MGARVGRVLVVTAACLLWLNACETSSRLGDLFQNSDPAQSTPPFPAGQADTTPTGTISSAPAEASLDAVPKGLLGKDPNDDLSLGKKHFRAANFGLAERYFRRAVELHPRDLESWVGLAASYDRLRRFDLADRAYDQAIKIAGPTAELLNNKGYSLMLRGDYRRARETLLEAHAQDPGNPYIKNNLELLEVSFRKGKAIR
jgi:Flp pilus assembly protein TadD